MTLFKGHSRLIPRSNRGQWRVFQGPPGALDALVPPSRASEALEALAPGDLDLSNTYPGTILTRSDDRVRVAEHPATQACKHACSWASPLGIRPPEPRRPSADGRCSRCTRCTLPACTGGTWCTRGTVPRVLPGGGTVPYPTRVLHHPGAGPSGPARLVTVPNNNNIFSAPLTAHR